MTKNSPTDTKRRTNERVDGHDRNRQRHASDFCVASKYGTMDRSVGEFTEGQLEAACADLTLLDALLERFSGDVQEYFDREKIKIALACVLRRRLELQDQQENM